MSRVALASIPSLTLYKGEYTTARRTRPVPQLICDGAPCKLYTPDVVRCTNAGGRDTHVDWTCKAELPDQLRLGRVQVSCEGYNAPGDPYVLEGSCSLTYKLVRMPMEGGRDPPYKSSRFSGENVASTVFSIVFITLFLFILFSFLKSCLGRRGATLGDSARSTTTQRPRGGPGSWFPSADNDPPPPYDGTTYRKPADAGAGWRPGFWTGTALGALGAHLVNERARGGGTRDGPYARTQSEYDWERERRAPFGGARQRGSVFQSEDRGEGSSSLGGMRTSTGFGGSSVR